MFSSCNQQNHIYADALEDGCSTDSRKNASDTSESREPRDAAVDGRYWRTGDIQDFIDALAAARDALDSCNSRCSERIEATVSLAELLILSYEERELIPDLAEAIHLSRLALEHASALHLSRSKALNVLGRALRRQHVLTPTENCLEEGIACHRMAIASCSIDDPERRISMHLLAIALRQRFLQKGLFADLEDAVMNHRRALLISASFEDDSLEILGHYCDALIDRFNEWRSSFLHRHPRLRARLDHYAEICEAELHPLTPGPCSVVQFGQTNYSSHEDLNEVVRLLGQAIELGGPGHPRRWLIMYTLTEALKLRFAEFGSLQDLDKAISLIRGMCSSNLVSNSHACRILLANTLTIRFVEKGNLEDSQEARLMDHLPPAIDSLSINDVHQGAFVRRPSSGESTIFQLAWQGIDSQRKYTMALADILTARYLRLSHHSDGEAVIFILEWISLQPALEGYTHRSQRLSLIGKVYMHRFRCCKHQADAVRSKACFLQALDALPPYHSHRARILFSLANLHLEEGASFHDVARGMQYLLDALREDILLNPLVRLSRAIPVLEGVDKLYSRLPPWARSRVLEAYGKTTRLLPRIAFLALERHSRIRLLAKARHIATSAASHALAMNQSSIALELLEQGRAAFWTFATQLRDQFENLPEGLGRSIRNLHARLRREDSWRQSTPDIPQEIRQIRRIMDMANLDRLSRHIRVLPGLERFMLPEGCQELMSAAKLGPVIILVSTSRFCHALIINPSCRIILPLSSITETWLLESSQAWHRSVTTARSSLRTRLQISKHDKPSLVRGCEAILATLWANVVWPILFALGLEPKSGRARPRVWWCPTGKFAHLPIHAAGTSQTGCWNYIVSSYIPTLSSLLEARRTHASLGLEKNRLLLAASPTSFNTAWSDLPCTVEEVKEILRIVPQSDVVSLRPEYDASLGGGITVDALLEQLPDTTILHLACHGIHDVADPLEHGFVLRDGLLTISQLTGLSLPRAFLAFLSACETAQGAKGQPDETIHLAATMLSIGFKSVIATLWSMEDVDGPAIARDVYEQLFKGGTQTLNPDVVPYALDAAVQQLRQTQGAPSRWAPYIHLGI